MRGQNDGVNITDAKLSITARVGSGDVAMLYPSGVCIQLFAMMIHTALKCAANTTMQVAPSQSLGPSRFPPNSITPRKPPSRKNAKMPSAASRLPNTLPTKRE